MNRCLFILLAMLLAANAAAQELSVDPPISTPLDTIRLRLAPPVCTTPESLQVAQFANRVTVQANRAFADCAYITLFPLFQDYTLGRFPSGDYDVSFVINPPGGTLGPSVIVGPIHFTVGPLPGLTAAFPHDDYSDMWWNAAESGQALLVRQSGGKLIAVWAVYDSAGRATWYTLQPGSWRRNASGQLLYSGIVYRTTGPYWAGAFNPGAVTVTNVGNADFLPITSSRAQFNYTIEGTTGTKLLERFKF